jgi:GMP synthase (glutamine-hydrolysing)
LKFIYIIKTGQTFENTKQKLGDFEDWVFNSMGETKLEIKIIDILNGDDLPELENLAGAVITGSHSMVTDGLVWSLNLERWIQQLSSLDIPILGICYGHQLIAKALGGLCGYHAKGKEIGSVDIHSLEAIKEDALFKNAPKSFKAHTTHSQTVLQLPKNSVVLAKNSHEPHHIVRFDTMIWGVQFHPEYDTNIMIEYIKEQSDELLSLGFDTQMLLSEVKESPYSNTILSNFVHFVMIQNNQDT